MTFGEAIKTVLSKKYATFSGRATRSEYWWWFLAYIIVFYVPYYAGLGLKLSGNGLGGILIGLASIIAFACLIPSLAVAARRLHDIGKSGWCMLIAIIPIVGLILIYWLASPSDEGENKYGPAQDSLE